ncbi:MAG: hypothetical protein ACRC46_06275 [Thermoguttaceae bacterium]
MSAKKTHAKLEQPLSRVPQHAEQQGGDNSCDWQEREYYQPRRVHGEGVVTGTPFLPGAF